MILRGRTMFAPTISKPEFHPKSKRKIHALSAFSFAYAGAKEKAIKKKTPISGFRALRSATADTGGSCKPLKRLDLNFNCGRKL